MDGFDLIRGVTALAEPPHIVMITAFGSIETAIRAVKLGAYDYITKPFEIEELLLVADKALGERALRSKVARLQREVERHATASSNIIAQEPGDARVVALVQRIAGSTASVLITGESGTGKELIARAIHTTRRARRAPFVGVNLAAVPEGAHRERAVRPQEGRVHRRARRSPGLFVEADTGTIFLDEIGELALPLQAKLLRVLQEHEVRPLGATKNQRVDVRVHGGDQPQPRGDARRRQLPRGSVLPAQRDPARSAAAARAPRGHRAARRALPRRSSARRRRRRGGCGCRPRRSTCCSPTTGPATCAS